MTSRAGRATINPSDPRALGICDRCGFLYNLRDLRFQMDWAGTAMINRHLRVCSTCYDQPQQQLRTIILPPDPPPVRDPRIEPYSVDEFSSYTLSAILGKPAMFADVCGLNALIIHLPQVAASVDGISNVTATQNLGARLTASVDGISNVTSELTHVIPPIATSTPTDSFSGVVSNTGDTFFTEVGTSIGTISSDRIVAVAVNGFIDVGNAPNSVTIGGISATLIRQDLTASGEGVSQLWRAAVPSGTTANIIVNLPSLASFLNTFNCAVWAVYGAVVVASSNGAAVASGSVSASVTPGARTTTIAGALTGASSGATASSMVNITEDFDMSTDFTFFIQNSVFGSREDIASSGSISVSANAVSEDISTEKIITISVFSP